MIHILIAIADYMFILNFKPDRWPDGDPVPATAKTGKEGDNEKSLWPGYHDIDDSPTKLMLIENSAKYPGPFGFGYEKRPAEELYSIREDPGCTRNLADDPKYKTVKNELRKTLESDLKTQGDPRKNGKDDLFESYPRFGAMRDFPGFKEKGKYNPKFQ